MKYISRSPFTYKSVLSACLIIVASGFMPSKAQNIVGKWESVSSKSWLTAEAAKEMGSPQVVSTSGPDAGKGTNEYKADHTFTMTVTPPGSQETITMKGKWALSGDQLKITMDSPGNPSTNITVVISGNTLVMSSKMQPPSKMTKVETTYKKII